MKLNRFVAGLLVASSLAVAVPAAAHQMQGGQGGRSGGMGMLRGLDLTEAQRNQIQAIREQYMAQIRPLQERMQADIRAVLTPEQQATVQEREQRAAARRQQLEQRRQQNQQ